MYSLWNLDNQVLTHICAVQCAMCMHICMCSMLNAILRFTPKNTCQKEHLKLEFLIKF